MKFHLIKTLPEFFKPLKDNKKPFEVRKNDRDYHVGDIVYMAEWQETTGFTGKIISKEITYILDDDRYCKTEFVVLGFGVIE